MTAWLMWIGMMAVMMLPAVYPWIAAYARSARDAPRGGIPRTALFAGGYLAVWCLYALVAAAVQVGLEREALLVGDLTVRQRLAGAALLAVGGYQLTPAKAACLEHCRSPIGFFLARWRTGAAGAVTMGLHHGSLCVACCWALMAVGLIVGMVHLGWMAVLAAVVFFETRKGWDWVRTASGVALVGWGGTIVFLA